MSENQEEGRALSELERALILSLLSKKGRQAAVKNSLESARVVDMQDGGMGSIKFIGRAGRRRSSALAEAKYDDEDGVLVSIELNADEDGELFEVDFWKVDFSALKRYPRPEDLRDVV